MEYLLVIKIICKNENLRYTSQHRPFQTRYDFQGFFWKTKQSSWNNNSENWNPPHWWDVFDKSGKKFYPIITWTLKNSRLYWIRGWTRSCRNSQIWGYPKKNWIRFHGILRIRKRYITEFQQKVVYFWNYRWLSPSDR